MDRMIITSSRLRRHHRKRYVKELEEMTTMGVGVGANIFKGRFHTLFSSSSYSCCVKQQLRPNPNSETVTTTESSSSSADTIKDAGNMLDIRVGRITKAWRHEEADSLYVEEVDVGEAEPRIICSGLVNYIPIHLLQDTKVVVLANLKPRNMRGVKSNGMLLAASDASHQNVELLQPPEASLPGHRIWFGDQNQPPPSTTPATPNQASNHCFLISRQMLLVCSGVCISQEFKYRLIKPRTAAYLGGSNLIFSA
ncbi:hypothetical protein EZV62_010155 [Acer yangbiense]|uniref:tRNA-binding domain-containing protein n=1 Tax=Acer yangbiense TaxID=1000413 RepID=A0A5C7I1J7_9ROSI|nr:hypothetical protein EZV62_010155 [Acer yangbiense]